MKQLAAKEKEWRRKSQQTEKRGCELEISVCLPASGRMVKEAKDAGQLHHN